MLKKWAILAVTTFAAIGVSGQPNKASSDKDNPANNVQPSTVTLDSHDHYTYAQQAPAKPNDEPFQWHAAVKRPEWWAVGIAIGTLILIYWQAKETRKAAEAANKQASHTAASERAWVTVGIIPGDPNDMRLWEKPDNHAFGIPIHLENIGKTPARIKASFVRHIFADNVDPNVLPHVPKLPNPPRLLDRERCRNCSRGQSVDAKTDLRLSYHLGQGFSCRRDSQVEGG